MLARSANASAMEPERQPLLDAQLSNTTVFARLPFRVVEFVGNRRGNLCRAAPKPSRLSASRCYLVCSIISGLADSEQDERARLNVQAGNALEILMAA